MDYQFTHHTPTTAERASIDAFGEFSIIGVPRGACRFACCNADERIEFEGFETGEGDGPI